MQKAKLNMSAEVILPAGTHDGIVVGGDTYIKISSAEVEDEEAGEETAAPPRQAARPAAPAPKVADDTKRTPAPAAAKKSAPAPAPAKKAAPAPAPAAAKKSAPRKAEPEPVEEVAEEVEETTEGEYSLLEDWSVLNPGDVVYAKLSGLTGDEAEQYYEATVDGWSKPKGSKTEKLMVTFTDDGQQQYLQDEDELYEISAGV